MKPLPLSLALLSFAVSLVDAGPILLSTLADPAEYQIVGEFQLQERGNEIFGNYRLTETDSSSSYLVVDPTDAQIVGEFRLNESSLDGSFELEQSATDQYQVVERGNDRLGTYTIEQDGSPITGDYKLVAQTPSASAPEPGTLFLAAMGAGCIALGSYKRRRRSHSRRFEKSRFPSTRP